MFDKYSRYSKNIVITAFVALLIAVSLNYGAGVAVTIGLLVFSLGMLVPKYRIFVFVVFLLLALIFIIDTQTRLLMGFKLHRILPDLVAISLDTNIDEVVSTLTSFGSLRGYTAVLFVIVLVLFFRQCKLSRISRKTNAILFTMSIVALVFIVNADRFLFKRMWYSIQDTSNLIADNYAAIQARNDFVWNARSDFDGADTVVLVLGETTRGDHFGINGYARNTTPRLANEEVISYSNAISNAAYTLLSTPIILTRSTGEVPSRVYGEKSLISAFKEAGYHTFYITYLNPTHVGDNALNHIINEADETVTTKSTGRMPEDIEGLAEVMSALDSKYKKKLIIYKLIGSHFHYHDRYNKDFEYFKPSYLSTTFTGARLSEQELLTNSYDNSIVVTDYVVSRIIEQLKTLPGRSFMAFISDHGTSIFEDGESFYSKVTKYSYDIPLFFWFGKNYDSSSPMLDSLKANINMPVDSNCFLDTFLSLANIVTGKPKGCDLTARDFKPYKRMVIYGSDIVDYDKQFN